MGSWRAHGDSTWGWSPTLWTQGGTGCPGRQRQSGSPSAHGLQPMGPSAAHEAAVARGVCRSQRAAQHHHGRPRFDVYDDRVGALPKWAEWRYGPQERTMLAVTHQKRSLEGGFGPRWGAFKTSRNHASKGALPRTSGSPSLNKCVCGVGPRFEGTHPGVACGRGLRAMEPGRVVATGTDIVTGAQGLAQTRYADGGLP